MGLALYLARFRSSDLLGVRTARANEQLIREVRRNPLGVMFHTVLPIALPLIALQQLSKRMICQLRIVNLKVKFP